MLLTGLMKQVLVVQAHLLLDLLVDGGDLLAELAQVLGQRVRLQHGHGERLQIEVLVDELVAVDVEALAQLGNDVLHFVDGRRLCWRLQL